MPNVMPWWRIQPSMPTAPNARNASPSGSSSTRPPRAIVSVSETVRREIGRPPCSSPRPRSRRVGGDRLEIEVDPDAARGARRRGGPVAVRAEVLMRASSDSSSSSVSRSVEVASLVACHGPGIQLPGMSWRRSRREDGQGGEGRGSERGQSCLRDTPKGPRIGGVGRFQSGSGSTAKRSPAVVGFQNFVRNRAVSPSSPRGAGRGPRRQSCRAVEVRGTAAAPTDEKQPDPRHPPRRRRSGHRPRRPSTVRPPALGDDAEVSVREATMAGAAAVLEELDLDRVLAGEQATEPVRSPSRGDHRCRPRPRRRSRVGCRRRSR